MSLTTAKALLSDWARGEGVSRPFDNRSAPGLSVAASDMAAQRLHDAFAKSARRASRVPGGGVIQSQELPPV